MAFYENVFIIRQDISSAEVDKLTEDLSNIVTKTGGNVVKSEYWGLRNLAYEIKNNKKAHYVMIATESSPQTVKELEKKVKFSEDVIRYMTVKVPKISSEPSPILKGSFSDNENTVDVTLN